eukprot:6781095-Pyramimonas_sp.AAC.1
MPVVEKISQPHAHLFCGAMRVMMPRYDDVTQAILVAENKVISGRIRAQKGRDQKELDLEVQAARRQLAAESSSTKAMLDQMLHRENRQVRPWRPRQYLGGMLDHRPLCFITLCP